MLVAKMNNHALISAFDNIYQRVKCQGFVPERDREELTRTVDAFVKEGGTLNAKILEAITVVLSSLMVEGIHLKTDKDKLHFTIIHELVTRSLVKLPIPLCDEECG